MGLFTRRKTTTKSAERSVLSPTTFGVVEIGGQVYNLGGSGLGGARATHAANRPTVSGASQLAQVGQAHGIVSAAVLARAMVASQLSPVYRDHESHNKFRHRGLALFEDRLQLMQLIKRAETHVAYAGNAYFYRDDLRRRVVLLQPEYVSVVLGSGADVEGEGEAPLEYAVDAEVLGYVYQPPHSEPTYLAAEFVAHWKPDPLPSSPWLGASWVTSVVREVAGDIQADESASKFFEQGSTPRLVYLMPNATPEQAEETRQNLEAESGGVANHWKPQFVGGGTDVRVVGSSLADLALRDLRGMFHTIVTARSRVPAVILGISEAMQGASLMAGNYGPTRRQWADAFVTPYLDELAAVLGGLVPETDRPPRSYMSWDPERVQLMQEDEKDAADILKIKVGAIRTAVDGGFEADSAVQALASGDLELLEHSGVLSVQVQPAGDAPANNNDDDDEDPEGAEDDDD